MPEARFCSACGAELPGPPPVTCAACGTSHWRNPKPCANAIVIEHEQVLLTRRARPPWRDAWCAPGGFCELGEHPTETAVREVLEETGLRVELTGYLGVWVDDYTDATSVPGLDVINVSYYTARPAGDAERDPDPFEVTELGWFRWDELPPELAPPGTLEDVLVLASRATTVPLLDRPRR